jgi:hypothetical protein
MLQARLAARAGNAEVMILLNNRAFAPLRAIFFAQRRGLERLFYLGPHRFSFQYGLIYFTIR